MFNMAKESSSGGALEKLVPILLLASIVLAFVVGMLWQKVSLLSSGTVVSNTGAAAGQQQAGTNPAAQAPTNPSGKLTDDQAKNVPPVTDKDHIRGNKNAKVLLIEYSDLQCPYCEKFHPTAQQVLSEYGDDVAWIWRHFPLDQIHPKARPAAIASECVADLAGNDGFWKFVDEVFKDQTTALDDLEGIAAKVGVNAAAFKKCVDAGDVAKIVDEQYQKGAAAGITGTPGNFIVNKNGQAWLIPGALPFESLKTTIDEALKS